MFHFMQYIFSVSVGDCFKIFFHKYMEKFCKFLCVTDTIISKNTKTVSMVG